MGLAQLVCALPSLCPTGVPLLRAGAPAALLLPRRVVAALIAGMFLCCVPPQACVIAPAHATA